MSTYNGSHYLEQQINSVLNQKGCNVDLLIRDDGSTDNTLEILQRFSSLDNVNFYCDTNLKPAKSFMHLLSQCPKTYDYYAFCDQDDVWDNDKIIIAIEKMKNIKAPALYCSNSELVDSQLRPLGVNLYSIPIPISFKRVLLAGEIQGATIVINNALANYFDQKKIPDYLPMHDYYVATVCGAIGGEYIFDFDSHMKYRQHDMNVLGVSVSLKDKLKRNVDRIFRQNTFSNLEHFSQQILSDYKDIILEENVAFLQLTSTYKTSFVKRFKLAFLSRLHFGRFNQEVTYRISILLGKL